MGFVAVLSYSRRVFLRFCLNAQMDSFLRGHVEAFHAFSGSARVLLYDNLKSVVLERLGDTIRFNPELLAFAQHYRFEPHPVAVRRGNEKGRVERHIDFIRKSFFAAREFADVADLNAQAQVWCEGRALDRPWPQDDSLTVRQAFALEQPRLLVLPGADFALGQRLDVAVAKTPYVRFDWNDYTVLRMRPDSREPEVLVLGPDLNAIAANQTIPHIYEHDGPGTKLCLWWPKQREWMPRMKLTETCIPWTAE